MYQKKHSIQIENSLLTIRLRHNVVRNADGGGKNEIELDFDVAVVSGGV